jgi:hypothetical protein
MLTGEIRRQIDDIWNDFWTGGVSNPLSVIEQITYLLFIKRLDELETLEEAKAAGTGKKMERRLFPLGKDKIGKDGGLPYKDMRWSRFKTYEPRRMFEIVDEHVFPFLRTLGGNGSLLSQHMKDARNGIPTPALLAKVVDKLDAIKMEDRDTKGDVYEYMLAWPRSRSAPISARPRAAAPMRARTAAAAGVAGSRALPPSSKPRPRGSRPAISARSKRSAPARCSRSMRSSISSRARPRSGTRCPPRR